MVVVLPAPLGPSSPSTSPCRTSKLTSATAVLRRKRRVTPSSSTPWWAPFTPPQEPSSPAGVGYQLTMGQYVTGSRVTNRWAESCHCTIVLHEGVGFV